MEFIYHNKNGIKIAELADREQLVSDTGDMLDVMGSAGSPTLIIHETAINKDFFDLSSRLAGEILQKVSNYRIRLAVIGDFTNVESKSLRDFIYESNRGRQVIFTGSVEEAVEIFAS